MAVSPARPLPVRRGPGIGTGFARDVRQGLGTRPKSLPSKYLYDALGSALFDAICRLPWYPISRAESGLLAAHGREILERLPNGRLLVDLGCGYGDKAARLLEAAGGGRRDLEVHLVDVSADALAASEEALWRRASAPVVPHLATYEAGLAGVAAARPDGGAALVLFLGSNIGNFHPHEAVAFLRAIRRRLREGDGLLLGADLVKPEARLHLAYDDPLGVTAAFNKNLLVRIDAELGGEFDPEAFDHRALWDAGRSRVEMHLVSRRVQRVRIRRLGTAVSFGRGETIWTESSYKYEPAGVLAMGREAGLRREAQWIEPRARFSLTLFRPA